MGGKRLNDSVACGRAKIPARLNGLNGREGNACPVP